MTDTSGHMFPSPEHIRHAAAILDRPLPNPVGREAELQQAGQLMREIAADLNALCRDLKARRRDMSPDSIREVMELESQFRALNPPWLNEAREKGL